MSELIWCYQMFSELGAYVSSMLGFSNSYNTLADAKKGHVSSKSLGSNIVDNVLNLDPGLIVKPITGGGITGGVRTGVTIRDIKNVGNLYQAVVEGVYATTPFDVFIRAVFDLCGLTIIQNDAQVIGEIANGLVPGTEMTFQQWFVTSGLKSADKLMVSHNLTQQCVNVMSDKGYFDDAIKLLPGITPGSVVGPGSTTCSAYSLALDVSNRFFSLDSNMVDIWSERNVSVISIFEQVAKNVDLSQYDFISINLIADSNFSAYLDMHVLCYNFNDKYYVVQDANPTGGYNLKQVGTSAFFEPTITYNANALWHGGTRTLEYEYGGSTTGISSSVLVNKSAYISGPQTVVDGSNLLSGYVANPNVARKSEGYKVPTVALHQLLDIYPWLRDLVGTLPGIIGDTTTAVNVIPLDIDVVRTLNPTLDRVQAIDWPEIGSLDIDEPFDDPPKPDIPVGPDIPEPDLPVYNANKLFTVHTISDTQMNVLGGYLWSSDFASLIEHMFSEPINAVLGMHQLHYGGSIATGGSEEIKLGAFGSGATGHLVTNRYLKFSCGSVNVKEYYGNVEDYEGFTRATLYLPYIGFQSIDVNEIMGGTVTIKYGIDVYTGGCIAMVYVTKDGHKNEVYNFYGQCACQLPVTSADYTNLISASINAVKGALIGGATGGIGGALVGGATGALGAIGSKVNYGRTNGFNNNVAPMGYQKPFILLQRPKAFNASEYNKFYGHPTNWTVKLSSCSGYTRVKDIHLDTTKATEEEKTMIVNLLKEGVIL